MSDFGAAARMDWTLQGKPFESLSLRWGLPLLPHFHSTFAHSDNLPAFEVSLDTLLLQQTDSVDRAWARRFAQRTDVCLLSRLMNLGAEKDYTEGELKRLFECVEEVSPRWLAFTVGFNSHRGQSLQTPLPIPKTKEILNHVIERVNLIKHYTKREISLVNIASMFRYSFDALSEVEFWNRLVDATGCKMILDVPAFYVSLYHAEQEFEQELRKLPLESITSVRVGAMALSTQGVVDAECGRLSMTHWGLLEDVLHALPANQHRAVFLKWFEPLIPAHDLAAEVINGQSALIRLSEV
ncbi:MAG: DUF692 domain-containing protein [Betaproteobacteria bacterium]|nr:DUF692 domain-containing protein [Betaproteobacteria bacterium]